jgi:hypothetical protein
MFLSSLRRLTKRARPAPRQARRQPRRASLHCEEFEPRLQPSVFLFSTGLPDGKIATISPSLLDRLALPVPQPPEAEGRP